MNKKEVIIKVEGLFFRYQQDQVLKNINFHIYQGQKTVILGPNGAGKSTLMLVLLAILQPEQGQVFFQGQLLTELPEAHLRQKAGYIFQNPDDQVLAPTVKEDILFGAEQLGINPELREERLRQLTKLLQIENLLTANPRNLSYGEKRRVALAGILIMNPDIIFFDEPLAFLDPDGKRLLSEIMEQLSLTGKTLIIATHDLDFAAQWGEHYMLLLNGEIKASGGREIFKKDLPFFQNNPLLPTRIFQGYLPDEQLPINIAESRALLSSTGYSMSKVEKV